MNPNKLWQTILSKKAAELSGVPRALEKPASLNNL
jgi:hypothetical protein